MLACLFTLSCALAYTVIVATKSAYVSGTDAANAGRLLREYGGSPMRYRDNGRAIASVVFLWPGMIATFARYVSLFYLGGMVLIFDSTGLLWHSLNHIASLGPKSNHARVRDSVVEKPTSPVRPGSGAPSV